MNAQVNYVYKNEAFTPTLLLQAKVLHPALPKSVGAESPQVSRDHILCILDTGVSSKAESSIWDEPRRTMTIKIQMQAAFQSSHISLQGQ